MKKTTIRIVCAMLITVMMMFAFSSCGSGADSVISLKMSTLNPWLEDTDSSEIVKIEEIHTYYGIAPETNAPETTPADTTPVESAGCSSFVALGIIACIIPAAVVVFKKKD